MCQEFFWPVENSFLPVEIFFTGREFFSPVENFFTGGEFIDWSRIFWPVEKVFFFFFFFFFVCRDNLIGECRASPVNCHGSEITVTITTSIKIF